MDQNVKGWVDAGPETKSGVLSSLRFGKLVLELHKPLDGDPYFIVAAADHESAVTDQELPEASLEDQKAYGVRAAHRILTEASIELRQYGSLSAQEVAAAQRSAAPVEKEKAPEALSE